MGGVHEKTRCQRTAVLLHVASVTYGPCVPALRHRALGIEVDDGIMWIWIGTHAEYDKIVG